MASFNSIVSDTRRRAIAMIERHGGRRDGNAMLVKTQPAVPAPLEIWDDYGSPVERISTDDERWSWQGDWVEKTVEKWGNTYTSWASSSGKLLVCTLRRGSRSG